MQTVFKIDLPKGQDEAAERPFIPRRMHRKSRGGCLGCKRRRVKCDEGKPQCGKCTRTNAECIYTTGTSPKTLFVDERTPASPTADMYSMSVDLVETNLDGLLDMTSDLSISTEPVRLLQHFQAFTSLTLGSSRCKEVMHSFVAQKAWQYPYLMHIVMAMSSAHLKRLFADASQLRFHQQYSMTEATHWQTGLQLYREQISNPRKPDFDATIATTFLTIIFTFSLDDEVPLDAYANQEDEKFWHAINPLAATGGFRAISGLFGEFMNDSIWRSVLMGSDDGQGTFSNGELSGIEGLPIAFIELCDLDDTSNGENNMYHHVVRLLTPLLHLEPKEDNFTKLMAFIGRTWPNFKPLIIGRDPRGLLLLSYWFALLRQVGQWWVTKRAKTECMAIVHHLSQLQNADITALLAFPASFGQADISCLWESPSSVCNSVNVFERYFQTVTHRPSAHLLESS